MRALLINPEFPDTFWGYRHALRIMGRRALFPPLGLLTVAAMLPENWELRVVDLNVRRLTRRDLSWADSAWITGMTVQADFVRTIIQRCRAAGVTTVAGGPLFTCEPERFDDVDHLVLDEAELTLPVFLHDLAAGTSQHRYNSIEKPDVTNKPIPRWALINPRHYSGMCVQFSRGCPFDCDFCNVTALFGRRPRTKTPTQIIDELDAIAAQGHRGEVFFVDDNLIGNKKTARKLMNALQEWRLKHPDFRFYTEASINLADDAGLTREMVAAGFDTVFVGIETPDEEALRACSKRQNLHRDLVADLRKLHAAGIQVQAGFILGFDTDTEGSFQLLIDFIRRSGIVSAMVGVLQAPIGTRLYERMRVEGRLLGNPSGNNVTTQTNIQTVLPCEVIGAGYRWVMDQLYNAGDYYERLKVFLTDYKRTRGRATWRARQWWTFVRATWTLGVLRRGRFYYWRLLMWTLLHRWRHLALAVRLWIEGHHFREICRRQLGVP